MPQLDSDAEGEDSQEHGPGLHLTHCLKQSTREPESMKQPKEERRSESTPAPGSGRPEKILERNNDDAGRNEWLNHPLGQ